MIAVPNQPPASAPPAGPVLRDIHLPPDPSWWPPAPGWWILAGLVLLMVVSGVWIWQRRKAVLRQRARVVAQLDTLVSQHQRDGDHVALASGMHQLLRRVARQHEPLAGQQRGRAWQGTLSRMPVEPSTLERLVALEQAIYRAPHSLDHAGDITAVRQWLQLAVKPANWKRKRNPARSTEHAHD